MARHDVDRPDGVLPQPDFNAADFHGVKTSLEAGAEAAAGRPGGGLQAAKEDVAGRVQDLRRGMGMLF